MLKATGERLVPELQRGELVYAEHLVRYRLAAQFAHGRRILDAGSGEGYGTSMLAAAGAASATGIDVDEESVAHAIGRYGPIFQRGDASALPFADDSFDLVVCFETIEHLDDDAAAIREFRRVLGDDGLLIVSTPNRDEYLVENEFHKREYSPAEFDRLLAGHFDQRHWLYQQNWLLSAVLDADAFARTDEGRRLEIDLVKASGLAPGRELYSIVLCGAVDRGPELVGVMTGVFEANRMSRELERMNVELAKIPELVDQLNAWIERARTAEHLRDVYEQRGDEWQNRATIAEERQADAERQVGELNDAIREIEQSLSWRLTTPIRAAKRGLRR